MPLCHSSALTSTSNVCLSKFTFLTIPISLVARHYISSMSAATNQAGPSGSKSSQGIRSAIPALDENEDSPRAVTTSTQPSDPRGAAQDEGDDEDEDAVDFDTIQSFAR